MKFKNFYSLAAAAFLALVGSSCGVNYIDITDNPDNPWVPEMPEVINGYMRNYPVWGTVTDATGNPLAGVRVVSGDCEVTTNEVGFFNLERIDDNNNRPIVKFEKDGFYSVVRSCYIENYNSHGWQVAMNQKHGQSTASDRFNSSSSHTLGIDNMSVTLPANGYILASTGEKYSGTVEANIFYLSPDTDNFINLMPGGDLAAIDSSNQSEVLLSYGMVNVELSDNNGNQLQIANGSKATLSFPTPKSMATDAPEAIPLWSFDETTGLWKEEGEARRDAKGNYMGEVTHFTWWNIDTPQDEAWIEGYVKNTQGEPLSDIKIIFNNQLTTFTDANGYYKKRVLSNTVFSVRVPSETYGNYTPEHNDKEVGPIASYTTLPYNITLPTLHYVYGKIIDQHANPIMAAYSIEYPGATSKWNNTDKNGEFKYYLIPGYKGQANISVFSQNGNVEKHEFYIPGNDNVYLEIKIGTGAVVPGQPDIIANCGNDRVYYLNAIRPTASTFGGVIIEDSWMTVISDFIALEGDELNYFLLQIPDYSSSTNEYDKFFLAAVDDGKIVQCNEGQLTVRQEGNQYYYSLSGKGYYGNIDADGDVSNIMVADITVNNVGISHLMTLERRENYSPAEPFQSFVPHLSTPAPVAMVITNSEKIGTGGFLYYNGDLSDFDILNNQAENTEYTQTYYDKETNYAEASYVAGNSVIMIEADLEIPEISSSSWKNIPMFDIIGVTEDENYPYESQVSVIMWNGGTLSLDFILNDFSTRSNTVMNKMKKIFTKRLNK